MIVRDRPTPWEVFFVLRGSVILRILPQMGAVAALSLIVVLLHRAGWVVAMPAIGSLPLSIIGAALAIFAAFRNSASYDRWWEARKTAGLMVIDGRNLAREALAYIAPAAGDDLPRRMALRCAALAQVSRDWLRGRPPAEESMSYLVPAEREALRASRSAPIRLLFFFSKDIAEALEAGRVLPQMARTLEDRVVGLTAAFSIMERTKVTPMPFPYTLLVHRTAYLFCLLLPFGLADLSGYWAPLVAAIISYAFFGLDAIADELQAPFADTPMTVPLDATARVLEIHILEMLGETDLPPPLQPTDYVLT